MKTLLAENLPKMVQAPTSVLDGQGRPYRCAMGTGVMTFRWGDGLHLYFDEAATQELSSRLGDCLQSGGKASELFAGLHDDYPSFPGVTLVVD